MRDNLAKFIRTGQTFVPGLLNTKVALQRRVRTVLKKPFDPDFEGLKYLGGNDGALYLDVGGNRGQSIDAISMFRPDAEIQSFEPNPELAGLLVKTFGERSNVTVHTFGLSDVAGEFDLYVPFYRGFMFDGLASLDLSEADSWLKERIVGFKESLLEIRKVKCRTVRLDELELSPHFIKLDIQGHELAALRGGIETLKRSRPVLLIEAPGEDLKAFLDDLGYACFTYSGGRFLDTDLPSVNKFFLQPAHLNSLIHG